MKKVFNEIVDIDLGSHFVIIGFDFLFDCFFVGRLLVFYVLYCEFLYVTYNVTSSMNSV